MNLQTGTVRRFGPKGFGFIDSDAGEDVYMHISHFVDAVTPKPGMRVMFELEKDRDGKSRARDVKVIPHARRS